MINYYELGANKRLNEIVMAGSHDAGINEGGKTAKTQGGTIAEQAEAGVRLFDIRITGHAVGNTGYGSGKKIVELKTYHGKGPEFGKTGINTQTSASSDMQVKTMLAGTYGINLTSICKDARQFVTDHGNEFLILKFDHCSNWAQIADACIALLGDKIYSLGGNLNTKTLKQLAGKVIVLFSPSGLKEVPILTQAKGIYAIKNLKGKKGAGTYEVMYNGLQYYGKGGTAMWKPTSFASKLKENIKKQTKLMRTGATTHPLVMGMMYWTSTGSYQSIEKRNDFMWNQDNEDKLVELWEERLPANIDPAAVSSAGTLKEFMPNFVMIDFASPEKCERIFWLNFVNAMKMHNMMARRSELIA